MPASAEPGSPASAFRARRRFTLSSFFWPLAVAGFITLVWVAHYERWTLASWQSPIDYSGDTLELLARIRLAMDGETSSWSGDQVIERLGAPLGADWSAYPASDKWLIQLCGWLARWLGLMETTNYALLLAHVTAGLSFYACVRQLGHRRLWVATGAVLYANTYMMFARGLPHLLIVFSWSVPCVLLVAWWLARNVRLKGKRAVILAIAFTLGVSNPYNLFFGLQLWSWAVIAQWLGRRRSENIPWGLLAISVALAAFAISNASYLQRTLDDEARPVLVRNYGGTEQFALKPIELLIPPPDHRIDACASLGRRYVRWSEWRGESFSPYLGWIGAVGLIGLIGTALAGILRNQRNQIPGTALQAGWVLAYASIGGLTNVVSFFIGLHVFRATNRFSIFLSAIALTFLVGWLSRRSLRYTWPRWASVSLAAWLLLIGLLDQVPQRPMQDRVKRVRQEWSGDKAFGQKLEARLGPRAAVFQMPVMLFPEETPPGKIRPYGHFRPYLVTDTLRFSYGALKHRPRQQWQLDAERMPPAELVRALEKWGFSALYLNRDGYADRGEALLRALHDLGYTEKIEGALGKQITIPLRPHASPTPPLALQPNLGSGWYYADTPLNTEQPRWAHGNAVLIYHNPFDRPLLVRAALILSSQSARNLTVMSETQTVATEPLLSTPRRIELGDIWLKPGRNNLRLNTDRPAERVTHERFGLRALALHAIEWTTLPDAERQP